MTIKGIAELVFDYADDYNITIPLKHAKNLHKIIIGDFSYSNFFIVVNGTRYGSWPEVIVSDKSLSNDDIEKTLKFFNEAGVDVLAYKNNDIETILRIPKSSKNYFATERADNLFKQTTI